MELDPVAVVVLKIMSLTPNVTWSAGRIGGQLGNGMYIQEERIKAAFITLGKYSLIKRSGSKNGYSISNRGIGHVAILAEEEQEEHDE